MFNPAIGCVENNPAFLDCRLLLQMSYSSIEHFVLYCNVFFINGNSYLIILIRCDSLFMLSVRGDCRFDVAK